MSNYRQDRQYFVKAAVVPHSILQQLAQAVQRSCRGSALLHTPWHEMMHQSHMRTCSHMKSMYSTTLVHATALGSSTSEACWVFMQSQASQGHPNVNAALAV